MKFIVNINKKLSKSIDVGYMNIDVSFGIGVCIGKYNDLEEFIKGAYIASDYAKKRKNYNIVIYNEGMKLEENIIGLCEDEINDTYVSGYVMVDPLYRGNSLHKILLETRIEESINRGKKNILTAVAVDNIFSLKTILNLGFEVRLQKENEYGIKRNILFKQLTPVQEKIECTA